jgi:hypothetical protein
MTDWYKYLGFFIYCFVVQIFLLEALEGLFWFHPFGYLFFLLILPPSISRWGMVVLAFLTGAFFDFFFNSMGIHATVCLWVGLLKPVFSRPAEKVTPSREYESKIWWNKGGLKFKTIYILGFIFFHHALVFFLESPNQNFVRTFLPTFFASSFATYFFILLSEEFIFRTFRKKA